MKTLLLILSFAIAQIASAFPFTLPPEARVWATNVVNAGSTFSGRTLMAVDLLDIQLQGAGVVQGGLFCVNPLAGNDYIASGIRLFYPSSITAAEVNHSFVAGDFVERGASRGIKGDGSSKYRDTSFNPSSLSCDLNNFFIGCQVFTTAASGSSQATISANNGGISSYTDLGWLVSGTLETGGIGAAGTGNQAAGSATSLAGFLCVQTSGTQSQQFYQNSTKIGLAATATSTFSNLNLYFSAANNSGTAGTFCSRRLGSSIIASGALNQAAIYAAFNQFENEMAVP